MQEFDVVIPYRESKTEELKYALRSLKNLPHRRVFICGDKPCWVSDEVICLSNPDLGVNAHHDAELNIRLAMQDPSLSETFILMNDDFYILKPVTWLPTYYTGTLKELIKQRQSAQFAGYRRALEQTKSYIGYQALAFELHIPTLMDKTKRMQLSDEISSILRLGNTILPRSIYYNRHQTYSIQREDVKLYSFSGRQPLDDFLSTENDSNLDIIKELFPEKSKYER